MPNTDIIRVAEQQRAYFDLRTGTSWDLYFAGYYRWGPPAYDAEGVCLVDAADGPQFSPREFDSMRRYLSRASSWDYSGTADLVLVNAFLAHGHEPLIDWESARGGPLLDANGLYLRHSLGEVIEFLTNEIEGRYESADWGVADRLWTVASDPPSSFVSFARDVLVSVIASVVAAPVVGH